jgi:hypothetical protein
VPKPGHPGSAFEAEPERRPVYREERRPVRDRDAALRVPAFRAVERFAVDFFFVVDFFFAVERFFAVDFFFAVERFAVDLLAVDFFAVERFFAVDFFLAVERFFVVDFLADERFFAVDFLAVERLAVVLRAAVFFFAAAFFFVPAFFAVDFFFVVDFLREEELRVDPERELDFVELRPDEREPERDDERVVAGTARAISAGSSLVSVVSPIADSPHVSSASAVGSLHEPAVDVSDASPVPLQSSSVMYDLLSRIARARFPTTLLSNAQCGQHDFSRSLLKRKTRAKVRRARDERRVRRRYSSGAF